MRPAHLIFLLALLPSAGQAAGGGVFCLGTMSFVARPEASGALTFKIMGSTQQKNVIELGGTALPHAGGWRYQVKSASTSADRCTVDIKGSGGGYSIKTIEGARCENLGGFGASALIESVTFTEGSRVEGAVPPSGEPDDFPTFDCGRRRFFSSAEPVIACAAQTPESVVKSLVAYDQGGWGKVFAESPTTLMHQYFSEGFNASWAKAMSSEGDVLDGDPITGMQDVTRVQMLATSGGVTGSATARIVAKLKVASGGTVKPELVKFDLKLENKRWKIDDITSGAMPSIRNYFRKSYGA